MPTRKVGRFTITEDHIVKKRSACDFETNTSPEPGTSQGIRKVIHSVTQAFDSPQTPPSNRRIRSFGPRKPLVSLPQTTEDTPFSFPQTTQSTAVSLPESTWGTTVSLPKSSQAIPVSQERNRQETVDFTNKPIYTQSNRGPTLKFQSAVRPNQQFWNARTYTVSNQDLTRVWLYKVDGSEADYSTRFEDLHPDSQKCLLVIEYMDIVSVTKITFFGERMQQYKKESETIDECTRLHDTLGDSNFDIYAATIHQDLRELSSVVSKLKPDGQQMILTMRNLMADVNKAIFTYSNWKDKQTSSAYAFYSGFPMRPSPFLTNTIYRFKDDILKYCKWLQENEELVLMDSARPSRKSSLSQTLHKLMLNVHDIFTNLAAKVEGLHQTVELNRKRYVLYKTSNPFQEADRREIARKEKENAKFQNYIMPCTTTPLPPPLGVVMPSEAQMQFGVVPNKSQMQFGVVPSASQMQFGVVPSSSQMQFGVVPSEAQMQFGNIAQFEDASFSTPPSRVMPSQQRMSEFNSQAESSQANMSKSSSQAVLSKQKMSEFNLSQQTGLNDEQPLIRRLFFDSSPDTDSASSKKGTRRNSKSKQKMGK